MTRGSRLAANQTTAANSVDFNAVFLLRVKGRRRNASHSDATPPAETPTRHVWVDTPHHTVRQSLRRARCGRALRAAGAERYRLLGSAALPQQQGVLALDVGDERVVDLVTADVHAW